MNFLVTFIGRAANVLVRESFHGDTTGVCVREREREIGVGEERGVFLLLCLKTPSTLLLSCFDCTALMFRFRVPIHEMGVFKEIIG